MYEPVCIYHSKVTCGHGLAANAHESCKKMMKMASRLENGTRFDGTKCRLLFCNSVTPAATLDTHDGPNPLGKTPTLQSASPG